MLWSLMTPEQRSVYELSCQELVPKHLSQEPIKNQNEREEVLEEVVPKRKKHKSSRRRKKIPSRLKGNSRLKRTKNVRKKMTPCLKSKPNKRGSKACTGMKAGTNKKQESSKRKERAGIVIVKRIDLKTHDPYLEWVQDSRNCFKLYHRCEVYKARVKSGEGLSTRNQRIRRISRLVKSVNH